MKPIIYMAEGCHQCAMVKEFLKNCGVDNQIYNVDLEDVKPPTDIFVYPALFIEAELVAYGEDIITYFKTKLMN